MEPDTLPFGRDFDHSENAPNGVIIPAEYIVRLDVQVIREVPVLQLSQRLSSLDLYLDGRVIGAVHSFRERELNVHLFKVKRPWTTVEEVTARCDDLQPCFAEVSLQGILASCAPSCHV